MTSWPTRVKLARAGVAQSLRQQKRYHACVPVVISGNPPLVGRTLDTCADRKTCASPGYTPQEYFAMCRWSPRNPGEGVTRAAAGASRKRQVVGMCWTRPRPSRSLPIVQKHLPSRGEGGMLRRDMAARIHPFRGHVRDVLANAALTYALLPAQSQPADAPAPSFH